MTSLFRETGADRSAPINFIGANVNEMLRRKVRAALSRQCVPKIFVIKKGEAFSMLRSTWVSRRN